MNKTYFMLHFCQVKPPMTLNATRQFECCNRPNSTATLGRDNIQNGICKDRPLSSQVLHTCAQLNKCFTAGCLFMSNQEVTFPVLFFPVLLVLSPEKAFSPAVASCPDRLWPWHGTSASIKMSQTLWSHRQDLGLETFGGGSPCSYQPLGSSELWHPGLPYTGVYSLALLLFSC